MDLAKMLTPRQAQGLTFLHAVEFFRGKAAIDEKSQDMLF